MEDSIRHRPKVLEALAQRVTALARIVIKKAREVPIVGKTIGYVEDTVSPYLEPVVAHVEKDGLYLLSLVDSKIHTLSEVAIARVPFAPKLVPQLLAILSGQPIDTAVMILDTVRTRGIVGSTADVWVDYEPIVKSESQKIYSVVIRVPGAHLVVSILHDISIPLMSIASNWLVMHTEFKDKHEISLRRGVCPSVELPVTPSKVPNQDESKALDFNALAGEGDFDAQHSSNLSCTEPVESTEVAQNNKGEIDTVPGEEGESASNDDKGKSPEVTVVHEDEEENDEVSDLFDTWGMGVKAIGPHGLKSFRSMSLNDGAGSKQPLAKPFTSFSRSFQF